MVTLIISIVIVWYNNNLYSNSSRLAPHYDCDSVCPTGNKVHTWHKIMYFDEEEEEEEEDAYGSTSA